MMALNGVPATVDDLAALALVNFGSMTATSPDTYSAPEPAASPARTDARSETSTGS
jgi:hypothetical protein